MRPSGHISRTAATHTKEHNHDRNQAGILADRTDWFDVRVVPSAHPGSRGWSVVLRIDGDYTDHETALGMADWFAELLSVRHVPSCPQRQEQHRRETAVTPGRTMRP